MSDGADRRRPRGAVPRGDDRRCPTTTRARSSRRWSAGRRGRADEPGGAARARLRRLLLPDPGARTAGSTRGYDFYALDLRKYGRSLREHQTPNFVTDLARLLRRDRRGAAGGSPSATATTTSWSPRTPPAAWSPRCGRTTGARRSRRLVLNSPWLDLQGSLLLRTAGTRAIDQVGAAPALPGDPARRLRFLRPQPAPRPRGRVGLRPGLEAAGVLAGVRRLAARRTPRARAGAPRARPPGPGAGADLRALAATPRSTTRRARAPTSCSTSSRSGGGRHRLADHVTLVRVEGAIHDVTLSREPVRERAFDEISRWLDAYVD